MLEQFNRRILVKDYATGAINEYGSVVSTEVTSWLMWAKVEQRSGSAMLAHGQQVWTYDTKITVRYQASRKIQSNMSVIYEGAKYKINNVAVEKEGYKERIVLRCSKTDEFIT